MQYFSCNGDLSITTTAVNDTAVCIGAIKSVTIDAISQPTLQDIFSIPLSADLQTMWMAGFGTPVICYLTAWSINVLIDMFNTRNY